MVHHPNAGGVLVVSLGCENNQLEAFKELVKALMKYGKSAKAYFESRP